MVSNTYCPPDIKSRNIQFGPQLCYVNAVGRAVGGSDSDFLIQLPFPCKIITLASILTAQNSVFFHLKPLYKNYTGNIITPTGLENWIPLTNQAVSTVSPYYWTKIFIRESVTQFYLDMGHENGAANALTILGIADGDAFDVTGGPYS